MALNTLYNKIWNLHRVTTLPSGQDQIFIGLHLIHEVTSPQAFASLKEEEIPVAFPERTFATSDHIIPTTQIKRPFSDPHAEAMLKELEKNVKEHKIRFFSQESQEQGIVHIVGPEEGLSQPGMTIACGDSHTSTHGAFGALAFGIGTSQVRDVLASGCLAMTPLMVRRIEINGQLKEGVSPKDVILFIIHKLGVKGGIGYAYEFGGDVFDNMTMEGRMTVCNMSIEGGARIGYVNPDQTTFDYIKGRPYAPPKEEWNKAIQWWTSLQSSSSAIYDDLVLFDAKEIDPRITWGITPDQSIALSERLPLINENNPEQAQSYKLAYKHTGFTPGSLISKIPIDVVFIGSCTNGRISDLREAAQVLKGQRVKKGVKVLIVPGSMKVRAQAIEEGLDQVFIDAGCEWRYSGCSMCLAMNTDKLEGDQVCASTSNRNFIGRQGSSQGKTLLLSPRLAAQTAIDGFIPKEN